MNNTFGGIEIAYLRMMAASIGLTLQNVLPIKLYMKIPFGTPDNTDIFAAFANSFYYLTQFTYCVNVAQVTAGVAFDATEVDQGQTITVSTPLAAGSLGNVPGMWITQMKYRVNGNTAGAVTMFASGVGMVCA